MNRAVYVPLDGSKFSATALPLAITIAQRTGSAVHLAQVHVPIVTAYADSIGIVDAELDADIRNTERAYLEAMRQQVAAKDVTVSATLLEGPVALSLTEHAAEIRADLIVMTTHGRGGLARMWLGSVADELVRHSHVPTLLLRPHADDTAPPVAPAITNMLIPLDGSLLAEQILAPAQTLGQMFGSEYTLVQVVDALMPSSTPLMPRSPRAEYDLLYQRQATAQEYLNSIAQRLRAEGQRVHTQVLTDAQPATAILNAACAQQADLIALATHGRGGVSRMLLGSVADKVLRATDAPVLLYRPQDITLTT